MNIYKTPIFIRGEVTHDIYVGEFDREYCAGDHLTPPCTTVEWTRLYTHDEDGKEMDVEEGDIPNNIMDWLYDLALDYEN